MQADTMGGVTAASERVAATGITITFGGVDVVSGVDLTLRAGEIHAVTGENGAGKSSLAKAIAGVYRARLGTLMLDGHPVQFRNPREALHAGIALIHQEPLTFPDLDVTENIFVGNHLRRGPLVDWKRCRARAGELLRSLGVDLDPAARVSGLSVAQRQLVELASALAHDAKVWIFDETTAPLTPKEVAELFVVMRRLRDQGCAIMIVTHHLHEVFEISDRITVLRDGQKVAERNTAETTPAEIVQLMVGRELAEERFVGQGSGEILLDVRHLCGDGFNDVSLQVSAGEVVGVAGLVGAGRTELARALFGITAPTSGTVTLQGQPYRVRSPQDAQGKGVALVPEDRIHDGLLMPHSISFNTGLASLQRLSRMGWTSERALDTTALEYAGKFNLAYRNVSQPVSELSGGNQQKVVLSRWLATAPKLLILDEPTRGVDVGAKHEVHRIIRELADQGLAVLMISSDLKEILTLSDRVIVMREGRVVATLNSTDATENAIMGAATGQEAHA